MGVSWILANYTTREYLKLPKKGEWCNDHYRLIDFLQGAEPGEVYKFVADVGSEYNRIIDDKEWSDHQTNLNEMDLECMGELVRDMQQGAFIAARDFGKCCAEEKAAEASFKWTKVSMQELGAKITSKIGVHILYEIVNDFTVREIPLTEENLIEELRRRAGE